jgi:hypothetical protein
MLIFGFTRAHIVHSMSLDSSVSIATRYGLDGSGIESRWGSRFSVKRPGRGNDLELYLYSSSGPFTDWSTNSTFTTQSTELCSIWYMLLL